jgi:glycosyltransferase involved in cell wall biosynthesis
MSFIGKKVLLVSPIQGGGIEVWSTLFARGLQKAGFEVKILFEDSEGNKSSLKSHLPDINTETFRYSVHDNLYKVCRRLGKILEKNCDFVYPNTSSLCYRALALLGAKRPITIAGCHGDNEHDYGTISEFIDYIDCIFAISSRCNNVLHSRLANYDIPIEMISYCVDTQNISNKGRAKKLQITFTGRFDRCKRIQDIIEVGNLLRHSKVNFNICLAGDGPMRTELENLAAARGLENHISFLGFIDNRHIYKLLSESHILLLLSSSEGFGLSTLEAMSQGVIPIITEVCGCTDAIDNEKNGFIVKVGDVNNIVRIIERLDSDRNLITQLSTKAQNTIEQNFTLEDMLSKHINLMEKAISRYSSMKQLKPKWKYDLAGYLDMPFVPNWVSRKVRNFRYGAINN